jgi:hypothetical protein
MRRVLRRILLTGLVIGLAREGLAQATYTTLDSAGNVGLDSDVAYAPNGLASISYLDSTNGTLKVAACQNVACTSAVLNTIDSSGTVGGSTSIAFGPDGRALISYQDAATASVKVARCADAVCSAATRFTVEDLTALHPGTAIGVGADGRAVVVYADASTNVLRVAHCDDADCSTATVTPYPGRGHLNLSLTIGGDGLALFAADTGVSLYIGHCANADCSSATFISLLGTNVPPFQSAFWSASLATGTDGLGAVVFNGVIQNLLASRVFRRCADAACTGLGSGSLPEGALGTGGPTASLGIRPDNRAVIAHYTAVPSPGRLSVAYCAQVACGWPNPSPPIHPLDDFGVGRSHQLAVGPDGVGLISYYDDANGNLKVAYLDHGAEMTIGSIDILEGTGGLTTALFPVRLSTSAAATVSYATQGGSAISGVDFLPVSGTLTFAPGTLLQEIAVSVVADTELENTQDFRVELMGAQGATLVSSTGTGLILDDDVVPGGIEAAIEHGSSHTADLAADPGPTADVDYYRITQARDTSWEVVADGVSGDAGPLDLSLRQPDGQTHAGYYLYPGPGSSLSMRWATSSAQLNQLIRVSGSCGASCGPDDVYRLRVYETTLRGARFNNSGSQTTVLLLQNAGDQPTITTVHFWSPSGALLRGLGVVPPIAPKEVRVIPLDGIPELVGMSGTLTVTHNAPYGVLIGKAVALEPATGFAFDTPLEPRPR